MDRKLTEPTGRKCLQCNSEVYCRKKDSKTQKMNKKFCNKHCHNMFQTKPKTPIEERFWDKVDIKKCRKLYGYQRDCWEWKGSKDGGGYGTLSNERGFRNKKAHRFSWELKYGDIPNGLGVLHACDNPSCVNPSHLMLGSHKANMIDMARKNRVNDKSKNNLLSTKGEDDVA